MNETEFRDLLQRSEPNAPAVNTTEIVMALMSKNDGRPSISMENVSATVRSRRSASGMRGLIALLSSLAAMFLVGVSLNHPTADSAKLWKEFHASERESQLLSQQLEQLRRQPRDEFMIVSATEIRASESLWMLLENETSDQQLHARAILTFYSETPAASRCRQMFPQLTPQF